MDSVGFIHTYVCVLCVCMYGHATIKEVMSLRESGKDMGRYWRERGMMQTWYSDLKFSKLIENTNENNI